MNQDDIRSRIYGAVRAVEDAEKSAESEQKLELMRAEQLEGCYPLLVEELAEEFRAAIGFLNEVMREKRGEKWRPISYMDARPDYVKAEQAEPQASVVLQFHSQAKRLVVKHEYARYGGQDKDTATFTVAVRDSHCTITTDSGSITSRESFIATAIEPFARSVAEGEKALAHRKY